MGKKSILKDKFGRQVDYLRLAVTDRCNLRCFYCMPEHGIQYLRREELLNYEEMLRLIGILYKYGVDKVRITGGEPFIRTDLVNFLTKAREKYPEIDFAITTNGVLTGQYLNDLEKLNIKRINLSLDTLNAENFHKITRRHVFSQVWDTFQTLLQRDFNVKINMVVMDGKNTDDILPMAALSEEYPVSVRFIEEMPFNGSGNRHQKLLWNHVRILDTLKKAYPSLERMDDPATSTSMNYALPGSPGSVGIIPAYSRTFCGTCNRIRITARGTFKTCLYDDGIFDLKKVMRSGALDTEILDQIRTAIGGKAKDGFEAEAKRFNDPVSESMSIIGG